MSATADLRRVILSPLSRSGLPYMITGSVAAIAYGEPRMTNDVDVVLWLGAGQSERLLAVFNEPAYYVPPTEILEQEVARSRFGHFNIVHRETALRADVYLAGSDPLHAWAFPRRRPEDVKGDTLWFAPLEYVIVRKLEYFGESGSDRHLRDIAGMLRVSGVAIDTAALEGLVRERGLEGLWIRARQMPGG